MQNAQLLSQPIWIVTQALYDVVALGRQRRREHRVVVDDRRVEDLGDRAMGGGVAHELGGAVHVVRAEHDVDVGGPFAHELAVLLGEAARHHDLAPGRARPSTS